MKTWTKVAAVVALCTMAVAGGAWAFGPKGRGRMFKHMMAMKVEEAEDAVDATDAQRKVIDAAVADVTAKLEARMQAHENQRDVWISLLSADTLDPQAIYSKVDAKADEAKAIAREVVPSIVQIHDVLTPAQRQKLADHARKMKGHGMRRGFGPPPGGFGGIE
jgi:Spy/CpxP family protein refolding chaperone